MRVWPIGEVGGSTDKIIKWPGIYYPFHFTIALCVELYLLRGKQNMTTAEKQNEREAHSGKK